MIRRIETICLLVFAGLIGNASHAIAQAPLTIGSKSFAESVILGELVQGLAENAKNPAVHKVGLGGTQIAWQALLRGDIDIYPEYTGTLFQEQFREQKLTSESQLREALARLGLGMSAPLGFNNSYAIGMQREKARELGITKTSQLKDFPDLRFGFSQEFMTRAEGWPALRKLYELPHEDVRSMEHQLAYRALAQGSVDIKDLFTTDAEIAQYGLVALEDDRKLFPVYNALYVYRLDALKKFPALETELAKLAGRISDLEMIALNADVKIAQKTEAEVARQFLAAKILESSPQSTKARETSASRFLPAWVEERLIPDTMKHLLLVLVPLVLNILIGIPLGVLAALRPRIGDVLLGVSGVIQTIPSLALLVFMLPILGIGYAPALFALFLYGLLPILRNTHTGLTSIPENLLESSAALGLPRWHRLLKIEIPLASRHIFSGIKISAVINVGTATLGAIIGAGGYGEPIMIGIRRDDMQLVLLGAIPAALMAILMQFAFEAAERFVVPKGMQQTGKTAS